MSNPVVNNPGCYRSVYNTGATAANWVVTHTKSFAASAGETLKKIAEYVASLFVRAKDWLVALPKEWKIALGVVTALTAATAIFCKCFRKEGTKSTDSTSAQPGSEVSKKEENPSSAADTSSVASVKK